MMQELCRCELLSYVFIQFFFFGGGGDSPRHILMELA